MNRDNGFSATDGPAGAARPGRHRRRADARVRRPVRALLVVATVVGTLIGTGGISLAYWHAHGTGAGSVTTGIATAVTLSPGTPTVTLYPGGQADVTLTVSNPNTTAVTIGSLALHTEQGAGGFAVDAIHAACGTSALTFTTQSNAAAGWSVPAKLGAVNGTLPVTLPNALAMDVGAPTACQGAQFFVYLVAGS